MTFAVVYWNKVHLGSTRLPRSTSCCCYVRWGQKQDPKTQTRSKLIVRRFNLKAVKVHSLGRVQASEAVNQELQDEDETSKKKAQREADQQKSTL